MIRRASLASRALPRIATTTTTPMRLAIAQYSSPVACRAFHLSSSSRQKDRRSRASFATVAPSRNPPSVHPVPAQPQTAAQSSKAPESTHDVVEKRDFHWRHSAYKRKEYENIQVCQNTSCDLT